MKYQFKEIAGEEVKEANEENNNRNWMNLPDDLLTLRLIRLYHREVQLFNKVCKSWDSIKDPREHCPFSFPTILSQWLFHKDLGQFTLCKFSHPFCNEEYCINISQLSSVDLLHSNNGWLLFALEQEKLFFINPFSEKRVDLPDLYNIAECKSVIFTSKPTSSNCVIFSVVPDYDESVSFDTIYHGRHSWDRNTFECDPPIFQSECHLVFHNGRFYCLGIEENIGVIQRAENKWTVHEISGSPPKELSYESYLVECDGELMVVFVSFMGKNISILMLDEVKMEWRKVENLGDFILFISVSTSFAIKKVIDGMENKIYFPRFYGDYTVFYCLTTHLYKTFGNRFSQKDLFETREQLNCT